MKTPLVMIDPGHGGDDSGAVGPTGLLEKRVNLNVAWALEKYLSAKGLGTKLTRAVDTYISLSDRVRMSNEAEADAFVSIHANAGGGHGYEVFTSPGQTKGDALGTTLFHAYKSMFPSMTGRGDFRDGDPDKEARFTVLTKTKAPAALFELGFIDNVQEEEFLRSEVNQEKMGIALGKGVMNFLGWSVEEPPNGAKQLFVLKVTTNGTVSRAPITKGTTIEVI